MNKYLKVYGFKGEEFVNLQVVYFNEYNLKDKLYLVEWYLDENNYSDDEEFFTYRYEALEFYNEIKQKVGLIFSEKKEIIKELSNLKCGIDFFPHQKIKNILNSYKQKKGK